MNSKPTLWVLVAEKLGLDRLLDTPTKAYDALARTFKENLLPIYGFDYAMEEAWQN